MLSIDTKALSRQPSPNFDVQNSHSFHHLLAQSEPKAIASTPLVTSPSSPTSTNPIIIDFPPGQRTPQADDLARAKSARDAGEKPALEHYTDSPHALPPGDFNIEGLYRFALEGDVGTPGQIAEAVFHPDTMTYVLGEFHPGPPLNVVPPLVDLIREETGRDVTVGIELPSSLALDYLIDDLMTGGIAFRDREPTQEEWYEIEKQFIERFTNHFLGTSAPTGHPEALAEWERHAQRVRNQIIPQFIMACRLDAEILLFDTPDRLNFDSNGNPVVNRDEEMHRNVQEWRQDGNQDTTLILLAGGAHSAQVQADRGWESPVVDVEFPLGARLQAEASRDLSDPTVRNFYFPPLPSLDSDGNQISPPELLLGTTQPTDRDFDGIFPIPSFNQQRETPDSPMIVPAPIVPLDENGVPVHDALERMEQDWTQTW